MTISIDQLSLPPVTAIATGLASVCAIAWFTIVHFRVLRIIRSLMSRLPLALADEIIREAISSEEKPLTDKRGSTRLSCHLFVKREQFNEQLDAAIEKFQRASTYPLKSRVSIAAVSIWLLVIGLLGMYFIGSSGNAEGGPSMLTNQVIQATTTATNSSQVQNQTHVGVATTASTNAILPAIASKQSGAAKMSGSSNSTNFSLSLGALMAVVLVLGVLLLTACLVVCYHVGVFSLLVEDVVTLCESIGLVTVKSNVHGNPTIDKIIPAKDDPEFNALLRLTKKGT